MSGTIYDNDHALSNIGYMYIIKLQDGPDGSAQLSTPIVSLSTPCVPHGNPYQQPYNPAG